ncbi:MAG: hypothetical protein ACLFN8_01410 [Candidatus Woesearchaeota archaeon]
MKKIKTGADKLIDIIQETNRISLDDASKALGVSGELVLEWAEFLEKEKLISIDYSFSKVFFKTRVMSSSDIKSSAKEVVHEKDAFLRKVEYAISSLDRESVNFDEIKKKFNSVHGDVKEEIKTVERELSELEKYNQLKSNIDKDIEVQKDKYEKLLDLLAEDIKDYEKEFVDLYARIVAEKEKINEHRSRLVSLSNSQKEISESIKSANSVLIKLKDDLRVEEGAMSSRLKSFDKLKVEFDNLSDKIIREKKRKISDLSSSLDKESAILRERQNKLFDDARAKASKLESYESLGRTIKNSFDGFFKKTIIISKKMDEIDSDKVDLKKNLLVLKQKAEALVVMSSNESLKEQADALDLEIKKQEEAKHRLIGKMRSLLDDLRL